MQRSCCIRGAEGEFVSAMSDWTDPVLDSGCEALGLWNAVQWIHSRSLYSFTFETDSKFSVDAINYCSCGVSEFLVIVSNIRNMLKNKVCLINILSSTQHQNMNIFQLQTTVKTFNKSISNLDNCLL